ncbi:jacalin-related lectin 8-like isoform X2 [Raphanus sativus]|uniref:Jacalin-related lectin 8-like isoform X2 n=1 Tax=Raphanus sativus TaxID=3726 RepID=A0A9W3BS14_RAPSA|nr:jacalin-related lectin 8-like isoform X2 [Raphanus sativus]
MLIFYLILLILSSAILDSSGFTMAQKLEAIGGKGGKLWDDGPHDNVAKVYIRGGHEGIHYIKFDYVKNGNSINATIHGGLADGFTQTLELANDNYEQIASVEGYYNEKTGVMQALQFKTNLKTSEFIGYQKGTKFSLGVSGKIITGFHGSAGHNLRSLGAYLKTAPTRSELQGGPGGVYWDDGPNYDGVRAVHVTFTETHIRSMDIDYDQDGQVVPCYHGMKNGETQGFAVDFPNEYMTSVEGTYNHIHEGNYLVLTSLTFKTSKGRTSQTFGLITGTKFVLESQGNAIIGFHGRDGGSFDAIGVYFAPVVPS